MASVDSCSRATVANSALHLQDFLGNWRDSMGHEVRVAWARPGNRAGELDVQLLRPRSDRDPIRLNVKALGEGQFQCGHFELKLDDSSADKIVWSNKRVTGKLSVWERAAPNIQTPGAWAPPAVVAEVPEKTSAEGDAHEDGEKLSEGKPPQVAKELSEVDRLAEAYDESLADYGETCDDVAPVDYPDPEELSSAMDDARATLLAKHDAKEVVLEQVKEQMMRKLAQAQLGTSTRKDASRDPRLRRSVVAPTGGA